MLLPYLSSLLYKVTSLTPPYPLSPSPTSLPPAHMCRCAPSLTGERVDAAGEPVVLQAVQPGPVLEGAAQHLAVVLVPRRLVPLRLRCRGRRWCCRRHWLGRGWEKPHSYFKGQKILLQFKIFKLLVKQLSPQKHSVCGHPAVKHPQPHSNSHAVGLSSSEVASGSVSFSFTFSVLSLKSFTSSWSRLLMTALLTLVADPMRSGRL